MSILTIAVKDLRLLARDPRAAVILVVMPLVLILVLGLSIGAAFGRKPDDRIRVSVVVEDAGPPADAGPFPGRPWADVLLDDVTDTGNIRVERIATRAEAERLVRTGYRSAVVVLRPEFSDRMQRCSFVGADFKREPVNPLSQSGVRTEALGVDLLTDPNQPLGSSVIQQVIQVSLFRVVIPWMIGQAFDLIGTDKFMDRMEKHIPQLRLAYPFVPRAKLGEGIRKGIGAFFSNYNFNGKTWAELTKSGPPGHRGENSAAFSPSDTGALGLNRGTVRYQVLVPAFTVTFAYFLVLTVGWLFVAERRHGTLVRLRAAPLTRAGLLAGKIVPCLVVSLFQGFFLLACGRMVFGMTWGAEPWLLIPVVVTTSFSAVGLAMLVGGLARTETQVAVYGTLIVLVLAGISGSLMPREMLPEDMRTLARVTPHAWALDAYGQLLNPETPVLNVDQIIWSCAALTGFGVVFLILALVLMRLD